jgi:Xaa-Pro aminopeptidase
MLTAAGCKARVGRLLDGLDERIEAVLVCRPEHVLYFSGYMANPNTLKLRAACFLLVERSGETTLINDGWGRLREPHHADSVEGGSWKVESSALSGHQAAAEAAAGAISARGFGVIGAERSAIPAQVAGALAEVIDIEPLIGSLRAVKDPDELELIRAAIRVGETMHASARENLRPGMSELELYSRIVHDGTLTAGGPLVMMCDFKSGPELGSGGAPSERVMERGDNVLLDLFPYVNGYRCDITNTLNVGGAPSAEQEKAMVAAQAALAASEAIGRPGVAAKDFFEAQDEALRAADPDWSLRGHAGHCLGLEHPEPPDFIPGNEEPVVEGMVITFEPGVYDPSFHGVRIEHNYLVTADGLERLSNHHIGLA